MSTTLSPSASVQQLQRRTERYEFADGVRDFQMAVMLLGIGLLHLFVWDLPQVWLPALVEFKRAQGDVLTIVLIIVIFLVPSLLTWGAQNLMNTYIRRRWLWRETGVIKPKTSLLPRLVLFTGLALMLLIFAGGMLLAPVLRDPWLFVRAIHLGTGVELAFMYFVLGRRWQIPRYRLLALAGLLGTVALVLLPLSIGLLGLLVCGYWVGCLSVSGVYGVRAVAAQQQEVAGGA